MKTYIGKVIRGDGIAGRDFDVPTANLDLEVFDLDPGVYAAITEYDGMQYRSTVCYGIGEPPKFEVHLFNFEGDLLGTKLVVEIMAKISELVPWESKERMRQKILHDLTLTQEVLDELGEEE